jgi:diadenylate cyclase
VVVSEETGGISVAHGGRMLRRIDSDRLGNILMAFFKQSTMEPGTAWLSRLRASLTRRKSEPRVK